jgi:hypothetical protein
MVTNIYGKREDKEMTGAQWALQKAIDAVKKIDELQMEIAELEGDLIGLELEYAGHYASTSHVDVMNDYVGLYVEKENGDSYDVDISLEELWDML